MERIKCSVRSVRDDDRSMLVLLAEETLHPLAEGSGHPELYCASDLLELLDRADVYVAEAEGVTAGFLAVEAEGDALTVRCVCVGPAYEARGVANQLVDWAEGLAIDHRLGRLRARVPEGDHLSLRLYRGHGFSTSPDPEAAGTLLVEKPLPVV